MSAWQRTCEDDSDSEDDDEECILFTPDCAVPDTASATSGTTAGNVSTPVLKLPASTTSCADALGQSALEQSLASLTVQSLPNTGDNSSVVENCSLTGKARLLIVLDMNGLLFDRQHVTNPRAKVPKNANRVLMNMARR